ncbi:MFS general substrate transporter [Auriscalpium vulgare]|uniref:MFS general substrate transporter n=1 Tax=Auriscalpium vulgare TaxID=40419 RepID=A0ACB8RV62_9AGAM|nr:MFS general substrate transporter [Auriscalpium vulgare]
MSVASASTVRPRANSRSPLLHPRSLSPRPGPSSAPLGNEDTEETVRQNELQRRAWWRRPIAWWYIFLIPFSMAATGANIAPRLQILTELVCLSQRHTMDVTLPMNNQSPHYEITLNMTSAPKVAAGLLPAEPPPTENLPCAADPAVQAGVSRTILVLQTLEGGLSCLTMAWWGSLSDRYGRTAVVGANLLGLFLADSTVLMVVNYHQYLPGGYNAIIFEGIFAGIMGGRYASLATMNAYITDCTEPSARSRFFSLLLGLVSVGVASGPIIGSSILHFTKSAMAIFYVTACVHMATVLLSWIVIPESLLPSQRKASRVKHVAESAEHRRKWGALAGPASLVTFLRPLLVFKPERVQDAAAPSGLGKRDWALTWVAVACFLYNLCTGGITYWFQYATAKFHWASETLGYWLSAFTLSRAIYLSFIFPLIIKIFKPKPKQASESERLSDEVALLPADNVPEAASLFKFDMNLVRWSFVAQAIEYGLLGIAATSFTFTVFTVVGSLGAGAAPMMSDIALQLYTARGGTESGKLFGALSVVQVFGVQVAGTMFFGVLYIKTVGFFPQAIFFVSMVVIMLALAISFLVRPSYSSRASMVDDHPENDDTLLAREDADLVSSPQDST